MRGEDGSNRARNGEAWATLLSTDDAPPNQTGQVLFTYLEAIRVMARSVRLVEARRLDGAQRRPFLVVMAEAALTADVRTVLEGDGLTPLALPTFASEGVDVPLRLQGRGRIEEPPGPVPASTGFKKASTPELAWWLKVRLWSLTQYRRIVYLDADVLVLRPIEELFELPEQITFAAPTHESRTGEGAEVSLGVMSLHPDAGVYAALVAFMLREGPRLQTRVRSVDQTLQHAFFSEHFFWHGPPVWDAGNGRFAGCTVRAPQLQRVVPPPLGGGQDGANDGNVLLGVVCALPPRYDFCVSYPSLAASQTSEELLGELTAQFAPPGKSGNGGAWESGLRAQVLHWTGARRKPWLHWSPLARTPFDELWWRAHSELCIAIGGCRLRCEE